MLQGQRRDKKKPLERGEEGEGKKKLRRSVVGEQALSM